MVVGINTAFSSRKRRDSVRATLMPQGFRVETPVANSKRFRTMSAKSYWHVKANGKRMKNNLLRRIEWPVFYGQIRGTNGCGSTKVWLEYPAVRPEVSYLKETGRAKFHSATVLQTKKPLMDMYQESLNLDHHEIEHEIESSTVIGGNSESGTKVRKQYCKVWKDFDVIERQGLSPSKKIRAICKHCGKDYDGRAKSGTSNLKRHLEACTMNPNRIEEGTEKLDQKLFRELMALEIIEHGLSFSYAEYEGSRRSNRILNPNVEFFSRNTLKAEVLKTLPTEDPNYLMEELPTEEELHKIEYIFNFLKPFYDITTLFSGVDYPTTNLYFENVCKGRGNLLKEIENPDSCLREVAKAMKEKFDKYWNEHCVVLAFAVILDPRFKLKFVKFYLKKFDDDFENKAKSNLDKLKALFKEYESASSSSGGNCDIQGGGKELDQIIKEFQSYDSDESTSSNKSQLELYLGEPRVQITPMPYDVFVYWKDNYTRYPELATMARDIMTIPITTVTSESTFSMGGRVVNQWRSSLTCKNAEALITTRNWLHGYTTNDDRSKATHVSISSLSQQAFNVVD
ncbi:putative Zinc finger, BED-type [Corchorus olitorius]|uniref:Zinc finger, BED-type n=1 Tax=Corchorus olitorius TaxID=93759 RepID=A0A1R3FXY1_9ROSI|nr:putative Zinc finger, BED-type [Corchorus olitorius]